jgi:hypothetical protein
LSEDSQVKRLHVLLVVAALVVALPVPAATVNGNFTLPTKYEDGSDLPVANIKHVRIEIGTCTATNTFAVKEGEVLVAPPALTYSGTVARAFGKFCARGQTETTLGTLSAFTLAVNVTKAEPKPEPPVLATPTVAAVFELIPDQFDGVRLGRNVGWVDAGTACANNAPLLGWYEVADQSDIHFTKNKPKSEVLVTKCEWS